MSNDPPELQDFDAVHTGNITPVLPAYVQQVGDAGFAKAPITTGLYKMVSTPRRDRAGA
jgi:hypothetical protein